MNMTAATFPLFAPLSRRTDPITSHMAERKLRRSGTLGKRAAFALACVRESPDRTAAELEKKYGVRDGVIRKRLAGLAKAGLIRRGPIAKCSVTLSMCVTWYVPEVST